MKHWMRMSSLYAPTLKEDPAEAVLASHRLLLRAGMIRKTAAGLYSYLPLAWRSLLKIEAIIRDEMDGSVTGARVVRVENVQGTSRHFLKMDAAKQKRVLDNCTEFYKNQAVRLTNAMPKWKPAEQKGRPVQSRASLTNRPSGYAWKTMF